jgi:hypothetical protein
MSPITHYLASWCLAAPAGLTRRERIAVTLAGLSPDLDGVGLLPDLFNGFAGRPESHWYGQFHHVLLHGALGATLLVLAAFALKLRRPRTLGLMLTAFHLHLACDFVGSRGPNPGDLWPIAYLAPFSLKGLVVWPHQWPLDAWQNQLLTALLIVASGACAVRWGRSPLEIFSRRADATVVSALQMRWSRLARGASSPETRH